MSERITPYTTTYTGRQVAPSYGEPALIDIAIGLSRMVRFAGQGTQFFSVAAHTLWMDDYYQDRLTSGSAHPSVRLAILLHDASEAVGSDIPSPHKSSEQRGYQKVLDERIFNRYFSAEGGWQGYQERFAAVVKRLDIMAVETEYWTVGPARECYVEKPKPEDREFFECWQARNLDLMASSFSKFIDPAGHPAAREYLRRLAILL